MLDIKSPVLDFAASDILSDRDYTDCSSKTAAKSRSFANASRTAEELVEKCRNNRTRGRLQPLVTLRVTRGFSRGLTPQSVDKI
jgi:hypothetical protein